MTGNIIIDAAIILSIIGLTAAIILYFVSKAFRVIEDPLIDEITQQLPGANCGGCGYAGCRNLAEAIVKHRSTEGLICPVGGNELAKTISSLLGVTATESVPKIAVVRCNGSCENAPAKVFYDAALTCTFAHSLYAGESACAYGCLGCGDCVASCPFDAIHLDPVTKLPVVDEVKCVACGACVKSCPRNIIELRHKGKGGRRVYVTCMNEEKGGVAKKNCTVACIGCGLCVKACPFEAITITNNLAYIDFIACKLCRKCVPVCPTQAIQSVNFPLLRSETKETVKTEV